MINYDFYLKGAEGGLHFNSSMGRMLLLQVEEGEELIVLMAVVAEVRSPLFELEYFVMQYNLIMTITD